MFQNLKSRAKLRKKVKKVLIKVHQLKKTQVYMKVHMKLKIQKR